MQPEASAVTDRLKVLAWNSPSGPFLYVCGRKEIRNVQQRNKRNKLLIYMQCDECVQAETAPAQHRQRGAPRVPGRAHAGGKIRRHQCAIFTPLCPWSSQIATCPGAPQFQVLACCGACTTLGTLQDFPERMQHLDGNSAATKGNKKALTRQHKKPPPRQIQDPIGCIVWGIGSRGDEGHAQHSQHRGCSS